ncbi:MAG: nucleoside transporter NupC [Phycisphaeraceae bacterium]|nr:MAG: nucleoside transporter NupC [Phycisphaeraceae bacterium]
MPNLTGLIGIGVLLALAWAMSSDRRRVPWKLILGGLALQLVIGVLLLKVPVVVDGFDIVAGMVNQAIGATDAGIAFAFGHLADTQGGARFVFAIHAMSVVIFFASLMSVLYHIGAMQLLIGVLAWVLRRTLGVTGTEAMAMAANVFVGQTEAPLCVKPYIEAMTRSQLMTLMVGGFATIAGSVLAVYVGMLGGDDPIERTLFIRHLLTASLMSAPAAFVMAKLIIPETGEPVDQGLSFRGMKSPHVNVIDAAASGASEGVKLAINIVAMLIAFVALLELCNMPIRWAGGELDAAFGGGTILAGLSIEGILGWVFTPLAWAMGVEWADCPEFGTLLGEKLVVTEFVAYLHLGEMIHPEGGAAPAISARTAQIGTYALCGFANFASIAIQIGGLSVIAPNRRREFVTLGVRAMFGGAFASWMTASVAGMLI